MRFGELGTIYDGPHATPERLQGGAYYFLNISSLRNGRLDLAESDFISEQDHARWTRRVEPRVNDLLFSYETRLGQAALMPAGIRASLGRRMALLRPNTSVVDPRFLLYWYLGPQMQGMIERRKVMGATVPRILLSELPDWRIVMPGLVEQQAIAEVLGALDDKIAANEKLVSLVEARLRAFFDRDVRNGLESSLHEFLEFNPRRPVPTGPAPQIPMQLLPSPGTVITDFTFSSPNGGVRFKNGDTLLARITPCLENGKTGYVQCLAPNEVGFGSTEYVVLRSRPGYPLPLSYFVATDPGFRREAIQRMVGSSGRQRVKAEDLAGLVFPLTDDQGAIERFGAEAEVQLQMAQTVATESHALAQLRDTLLPALMDGTLRVKDAVAQAEGVL